MGFSDRAPDTTQERDLLAACARLASIAGRGAPTRFDRLGGGRNNRVYRVVMDGGSTLVLKHYHADLRDPRDRLGAEWAFLEYAWARGIRSVPEPLARDQDRRLGLYSFLSGRAFAPGEIAAHHVAAAADFICSLNVPRPAHMLAPGSEACFTPADHLAAVERRVARLNGLDPGAPGHAAASKFVERRLLPTWRALRERIVKDSEQLGLTDQISTVSADVCVSPSDFGFHNALIDDTGIAFVDFEYAGSDSATKLICDFFCQPEVPVPFSHYEYFVGRVGEALGLNALDYARCSLLLDAYRVKWICIMLNEFVVTDAARRAFASEGARAELCAAQLAKAQRYLAQIAAS